jgi:hypothetical protein
MVMNVRIIAKMFQNKTHNCSPPDLYTVKVKEAKQNSKQAYKDRDWNTSFIGYFQAETNIEKQEKT